MKVPIRWLQDYVDINIPLAELAPDYQHPETGQTLRDIARGFEVAEEEMRLRPGVSQALAQLVTK